MAAQITWDDPDVPLVVDTFATAPSHLSIAGALSGYEVRMRVKHTTEAPKFSDVTSGPSPSASIIIAPIGR